MTNTLLNLVHTLEANDRSKDEYNLIAKIKECLEGGDIDNIKILLNLVLYCADNSYINSLIRILKNVDELQEFDTIIDDLIYKLTIVSLESKDQVVIKLANNITSSYLGECSAGLSHAFIFSELDSLKEFEEYSSSIDSVISYLTIKNYQVLLESNLNNNILLANLSRESINNPKVREFIEKKLEKFKSDFKVHKKDKEVYDGLVEYKLFKEALDNLGLDQFDFENKELPIDV